MGSCLSNALQCFIPLSIAWVMPYASYGIVQGSVADSEQTDNILLDNCNFTRISEEPSRNYLLLEDINLSGFRPWSPIPLFTGKLDGGGYTLYGLNIDETDSFISSGLFRVAKGATITNLGFANFSLENSGAATNAGIVAGVCEGCKATNIFFSDGRMKIGVRDSSHSALGIVFGHAKNALVRFTANSVAMDGNLVTTIGGGAGFAISSELVGALQNISQKGDYSWLGVGVGHAEKNSRIYISANSVSQKGEAVYAGIGVGWAESGAVAKVVFSDAHQYGSGYLGGGAGVLLQNSTAHTAAHNFSQTANPTRQYYYSYVGVGSGYAENSHVYAAGNRIRQRAEKPFPVIAGGTGYSADSNIESLFFNLEQSIKEGENGAIAGGTGDVLQNSDESTVSTILHNVTQRANATWGEAGGGLAYMGGEFFRGRVELLAIGLVQNLANKEFCGIIGGHLTSCSGRAVVIGEKDNLCRSHGQPENCNGTNTVVSYSDITEATTATADDLGFSGAWDTGANEQLPMLPGLNGLFQDLTRLSTEFAEHIAARYTPPGPWNESIMPADGWNTQMGRLPFPSLMDHCLTKQSGIHCGDSEFACFANSTESSDCPQSTVPPVCEPQLSVPVAPSTTSTLAPHQPTSTSCSTIQATPLMVLDQPSGRVYVAALQSSPTNLLLVRYLNDSKLDTDFGTCGRYQWQLSDLIMPVSVTSSTWTQNDSGLKITLFIKDGNGTHWASVITDGSDARFSMRPLQPPTEDDLVVRDAAILANELYYTGYTDNQLLLGTGAKQTWLGETGVREKGYALLPGKGGSLYITGSRGENVLFRKFNSTDLTPDGSFGDDGAISRSFITAARGKALLLDDDLLFVAGNIVAEANDLFLLAYTLDGQPAQNFTQTLKKTPFDSIDAEVRIIASERFLYLIKFRGEANNRYNDQDFVYLCALDRQGEYQGDSQRVFHFGTFEKIAAHGLSLDRVSGVLWFAVTEENDDLSVYGLELPYWHDSPAENAPNRTDTLKDDHIPVWVWPVTSVGVLLATALVATPLIALHIARKKANKPVMIDMEVLVHQLD